MKKDHMGKRLFLCIVGVVLSGIAVGFFKRAVFGVDPYQSLMSGLDSLLPIPFGTLYLLATVVLLLFSLVFDRHYIGLATFINIFLLGYIVDFTQKLLFSVFPELALPGRVLCLIIGVLIACFAASMYFTADLGVSTYDAIALIIAYTWKKWQFRFVRITTDLVCVLGGVSLYLLSGGPKNGLFSIVGVGTIISALFMGPMIDLFNRKVWGPFLKA